MAQEKKDKKRKDAPTATAAVADPPAKKSKKVAATMPAKTSEEPPKSILKKKKDTTEEATNGTETSTKSLKVDSEPARKVKPRKRAADFLSDDEDSDVEIQTEPSKPSKKQSKKSEEEQAPAKAKESKDKSKKNGVDAKAKKHEAISEESDDASDSKADSESDEGEDDRTAELIKGFESSGDEEDPSEDEGFDPNHPVPRIPDSKKTKRKIIKKQKKNDDVEQPGTIYVGRIPHGFYEHQMRAYFSQFGDITRLRLSRNRVTGRSKHYAFIEFASASVAKIVAETMDNYLMYGHILKCKFVPQEQLHPEIWKGANRRFKRTPWNRIEKQRLERGKTREKWAQKIEQEEKRRRAKAEKLKALGYEFEMPALKSVDEVPVQGKDAPKAIEEPTAEPVANGTEKESVKALEAPSTNNADKQAGDDDTPKKSSKQDKKEKNKEKRLPRA
ncbi:Ribosomal biogenesis protein Gar2 [Rasamsonia emersonii CBS 393.64]|uniref:Ribosomal biogenesis protein Gar2 n=1 Tax=Rasamsonia emersonii (strain ATCC 16479 / CBS 393.64 / IMI 116815) TaxID=1408163 RepID=A0A0F4Z5M4_RASE3|nr:Ribosomal biogenesis protein Gar2 [Rasamsonia emersonii CBS 393.64]KKA25620.1 Ribosomal biogenesis protein Gar2 [Rasamsonia emersonii CBS 393.64]